MKKDTTFLSEARPRKEVFRGRIINVGVETVKNARGETAEFEIVRHPGGACIAAINSKNEICLLKQYRHALDEWIWEIPAGKLEPGESPEESAPRELQEEAGVIASHWQSLGHIFPSPAIFDEKLHLYLAWGLQSTETAIEPHEFIEVHWTSLDKARQWALDGTITDSKTIIAVLRACDRWQSV